MPTRGDVQGFVVEDHPEVGVIHANEQFDEVNANQKLHDWAIAEKMAKDIMEEYGIQ